MDVIALDTGAGHTRAEWEQAAAAVLRRAGRLAEEDPDHAVWEVLARHTYDGIAISPLGTPDLIAQDSAGGRPGRAGAWDVRVRAGRDHEATLADLENGATSLWLDCVQASADDLAEALKDVRTDAAAVVLDRSTPEHAGALVALGTLHPDTNLGATEDADLVPAARMAIDAGVRAIVVDGTTIHERGASDGQELGWILARGARVLRILEAAGIDPAQGFGLVELRVAATDEQFPTIAKLRALRRLWSRLAELCEVADPRIRVHAVTSRPMTSKYDAHVNLLRATVAAFAAGVGGADAITVVPYDEPTGESSILGRRLARNISALLVEESHVAVVADAAGGAFAVERLTDDLAGVAWAELGRLEDEGDPAPFETRVAHVRAKREADVATRRRAITGLSEFADPADPTPQGDSGSYRYGAAFEAMRDDPVGEHLFVATLGSVAEHTARAGFARNLFAAAGIPVDVAGPTSGVDAVLAAYDGQRVVCLAGTDAAYAELGEPAASALREAGAATVIVAGKPHDWADESCAAGVDAVAFSSRIREALR